MTTATKQTSVLQEMATFCATLSLDQLDESTVDWAKFCVIDAVEACINTIEDDRHKAAFNLATDTNGTCTLFGRSEMSTPEGAALYNAITGSISSRNDISFEGNAHPAAALMPLVVALGEALGADGKTVLEALIVGYEMLIRFGKAISTGNAKIPPALRPTSLGISFASAFAASKMMKYTSEQTAAAAAMSCHYLAGLNEWRLTGTGEDVYLNALAARNGLFCTRMIGAGASATMGNLDGEYGLLSIFNARENAQAMVEGLGADYKITQTCHKPVAACRALQTPCFLADELLAAGVQIDTIESIVIHAAEEIGKNPWYIKNSDVNNLVQAILSIPFGIASALVCGGATRIRWLPPYDSKVVQIMMNCRFVYHDGWNRDAFTLELHLASGETRTVSRATFPSIDKEKILSIFRTSAESIYGFERTEQLIDAALRMEKLSHIRQFSGLLAK